MPFFLRMSFHSVSSLGSWVENNVEVMSSSSEICFFKCFYMMVNINLCSKTFNISKLQSGNEQVKHVYILKK